MGRKGKTTIAYSLNKAIEVSSYSFFSKPRWTKSFLSKLNISSADLAAAFNDLIF